jgi:hypothetical protein
MEAEGLCDALIEGERLALMLWLKLADIDGLIDAEGDCELLIEALIDGLTLADGDWLAEILALRLGLSEAEGL